MRRRVAPIKAGNYGQVMEWVPPSKQDVLRALEADWIGVEPALQAQLAAYLVEPARALLQRFETAESVFTIARINHHVVFYDDVEQEFGTAHDVNGTLCDINLCGNVVFALSALERFSAGSA